MSPVEQQLFAAPGSLIPLSQAAKLTPYSSEYLRLLIRKGSVKGVKLSRDWLTTKSAVLEYVEQQKQKHQFFIERFSKKHNAQAGFASVKLLLVLGLAIMATSTVAVLIMTGRLPNKTLAQISAPTGLLSLGQALLGKTPEEYLAEDLAASPTPLFALAKHRIEPRGPEVPPPSTAPTSASADASASQQPQVLGESVTKSQTIPSMSASSVLSDSTTAGDLTALIANAVRAKLNELIASGILKGPKGDKGDSPAVIIPANPGLAYATESYYQPNQSQNFIGGSVQGVSQLSSESFVTTDAKIGNNLTVGGTSNFSGPATFSGTTTIAGLTVTTLNPGLTQGSIAFQGASGLTQDNANFFYDSTNHRLGIGTSSPSATLQVYGTGGTNPFLVSSSTGTGLMVIQQNGNVGIGTTTPTTTLFVQGTGGTNPFAIASSTGTQLLTVLQNGNVGIGTTSPTAQLHLYQSTASNFGQFRMGGNITNNVPFTAISGDNKTYFVSGAGSTISGGGLFSGFSTDANTAAFLIQGHVGSTTPAATGFAVAIQGFKSDGSTSRVAMSGSDNVFAVQPGLNPAVFVVQANGNVGIGTTSPGFNLHILSTTDPAAVMVDAVGTVASNFIGRRANGSVGSLSAVQTNDTLANFMGRGYNGTAYSGDQGGFQILADGNWTSSSYPTRLRFFVTPANSTTGFEAMRLTNAGYLGIGTITPTTTLYVQGTGGTNPFAIASSTGVNLVTVLQNGNVGIGTTSPGFLLDIVNNGVTGNNRIMHIATNDNGGSASLTAENTGAGGAFIRMAANGSTYTAGGAFAQPDYALIYSNTASRFVIGSYDNVPLGLATNNSEVMTILGNGNVGIGTTSPIATLALTGTGGTNPLVIASSTGSTLLTVLQNGNVGIGTTSPGSILSVASAAPTITLTNTTAVLGVGTASAISFVNSDISTNGGGEKAYIRGLSTDSAGQIMALAFGVGNDTTPLFEAMRINGENGNVGIGTTIPGDGKLEIAPLVNTVPAVFFLLPAAANNIISQSGVSSSSGWKWMQDELTTGDMFLKRRVSAVDSDVMYFKRSNGNVGIGTTSPLYLLHVGSASVASGTVARFQNANGTCDINPTNAGLQCSSDQRLKQNINTMSDMLQKLLSLNPVFFNWNSEASGTPEHPGFIAQQVETVFPELVSTDGSGLKSIGYSNFIPYLVSAIQSQQKEILALQGSLIANATTSNLTVYNPGNFSGDSIGEARILMGQTSVRVIFSQPYQYQPIITLTPEDQTASGEFVTDRDAGGFTIRVPTPVSSPLTFAWHSFASPAERLTVSDGTTAPIPLILPAASPPATPATALAVVSDPAAPTTAPASASSTPDSTASSTPQVFGASTSTPAAASPVISSTAHADPATQADPTPAPAPPTTAPTASPAPSADQQTSSSQ